MARKFLQVVGFLALLGLAAAAAASVFLIPGKLSVTVVDEAAVRKSGPDPVALLRDEVSDMRRDVSALAQALSKNFEALDARQAREDESAAAGQAAMAKALLAWKEAGAHLADESPAAADRHHEVIAALNDLGARMERALAQRSPAPAPASASVSVSAPPPQVLPKTTSQPMPSGPRNVSAAPPSLVPPAPPPRQVPAGPSPTVDASSGGAPAPGPAAAPAGRRKSFLSFSLPSEGFSFDKVQRFEVIPELSRVGFDGKSTIHDFSGVTSEVSGRWTTRLSQPGPESQGSVEAKAASLDTGLADRDKEMRGTIDVLKFPTISFTLASFHTTKSDPKAMTLEGTAQGKLSIHGIVRDVTVPLRLAVDESKRLSIEGEVAVRLKDYGVTPPSKAGIINMENEIRVWLNLRARAVGVVDAAAATAGK